MSARLTHFLGVQLAELTLGRGKSQTWVAESLGVSTKHVNRVWNGYDRGTDDFLGRWADLLGYEVVLSLRLRVKP